MAKKTLGTDVGKEIVLTALKGILSRQVRELHVTLGTVLPKKTDRENFTYRVVRLINARNYVFASKIAFDASMKIRDIIGSIGSSALPGAPTIPEPDKPSPTMPPRRKPAGPSRKEKKARPSAA